MSTLPLYLTLKVAATATVAAVGIGVPLAWALARRRLPGAELWSALVMLPLILPPTVLGYYLLLLIGRQGWLGRFLEEQAGTTLVFTWWAAALAATVVALPLVVETVRPAFEAIDPDLPAAARTLGHGEWSIFWRVEVPLASRALLAGTLLAFARAMGEFGATLMVAGNIPGRTQTLALAIYDAVQAGRYADANVLVAVASGVAITVVVLSRRLGGRRPG